MINSTIIFYTHNLLFPKLFKTTIANSIQHAFINNCKLIFISHYPIFTDYIDVMHEFKGKEEDGLPEELKPFLIKNLNGSKPDFVTNYVTGKMPYTAYSILDKLIFASEKCDTENMILFEHDCFYPDNYISVVEDGLSKYSMTYCLRNYDMLNKNGFYRCEPHAFLSSFSAKTKTFNDVFTQKRTLYTKEVKLLEPMVPYELIIKDINWKDQFSNSSIKKILRPRTYKDVDPRVVGNSRNYAGKENVVEDSLCIDECLGDDQTVLELEHGLNTSNSLSLMRHIYDNSALDEEFRINQKTHPCWGDSKYFIDMFENIATTELTNKIHAEGTHKCNL